MGSYAKRYQKHVKGRNRNKRGFIILSLILFTVGFIYLMGVGYYSNKFIANTELFGVEVGGLTLEQAESTIQQTLETKPIIFTESGSELKQLSLSEMGATVNLHNQVETIYNNQDPQKWVGGLVKGTVYTLNPKHVVTLEESNLVESFNQHGIGNATRQEAQDAEIAYSQDLGYTIKDEVAGNQLYFSGLRDLILSSIREGQVLVDLGSQYLKPERTSQDEELTAHYKQIQDVLSTSINLQLGDERITITPSQIESWMYFDNQNQLKIDRELVSEFLGELNEKYATYDMYRNFDSSARGQVSIQPGTLGWSIDRGKESDYIATQLEQAKDSDEVPYINGTGFGESGIGGDYVEVDLVNQHMYVYLNHNLMLDTEIVSGQVGTDTVAGAYAVWNKESPSNLVGYNPRTEADYVQPVSYWIAFDDTGQGIHDANWQPNFGGEAYLSNGSLGCINTPPNIMPQVYDLVYNGMPVIVH